MLKKAILWTLWTIALLSLWAAFSARKNNDACETPSACQSQYYWQSPLLNR